MKRSQLKIGQRVRVVPLHTNKDIEPEPEKLMYVQELHNPNVAGLSHRKNERQHIYGVLYSVIYPLKKPTKKKQTALKANRPKKYQKLSEVRAVISRFESLRRQNKSAPCLFRFRSVDSGTTGAFIKFTRGVLYYIPIARLMKCLPIAKLMQMQHGTEVTMKPNKISIHRITLMAEL